MQHCLDVAVRRTVQHCLDVAARHYNISNLILVDLAGNERDSARKGLHEPRLRMEGIDVNASLCALNVCLRMRAKNSILERKKNSGAQRLSNHDVAAVGTQLQVVPQNSTCGCADKTLTAQPAAVVGGAGLYRASALTRLLKQPLARAKIFFLACCSTVASSAAATGQTLAYAAMVKHIKTSAEDSAVLLEHGMDCFPIGFLPLTALIKHRQIPRSNERLTVYLHEIRVSVVRVMVSHRWLSPSADPRKAHPDSGNHPKHELLSAFFQTLGNSGWIMNYDALSVVTWLDFGESLPQTILLSSSVNWHRTARA